MAFWTGIVALLFVWFSVAGPAAAHDDTAPKPIDASACKLPAGGWAQAALARSSQKQLGLPAISSPPDNPPSAEKIRLGRKLFFDRRLSINGTMSCGMCHIPEQAFVNREMMTAVGVEGRSVKRNAPTLINVAFLKVLFHDGREVSLETQFVAPMVARNEMANPSIGLVIRKLQTLADYRGRFERAFGGKVTLDRLGMALAAYQRSLTLSASPFDKWYYGKNEDAVSPAVKRGFELFTGQAGCASCHSLEEDGALFTDQQFHDTGYGWMREQQRQNPPKTVRVQVAPGVFHEVDHGQVAAVGLTVQADIGRYEVSEKPQDRWKFRTAPLRNVAVTPPYMHDGGLARLEDVIEFYNSGGPTHAQKDPRIHPLGLSADDQAALKVFLQSLTSENLSCLAAEARSSPPDNN